jgi:mono/diheme cytochrome c family protein
MGVIFLALSAASFVDSRGQVMPEEVTYAGYDAVAGKRVFQAYNCMDCHTMVGNGAYFAPDLTEIYAKAGPAWLSAFLPSAGSWPTEGAIKLQLRNKDVAAAAGVDTVEAYLKKYPGAAERIHRRGGLHSDMPNLPFTHQEVDKLIAFLKYTSEMNTEGWPPKPDVNGLTFPEAKPMPGAIQQASVSVPTAAASAAPDSAVARGKKLAEDSGCTACHAATHARLVGPGWEGLYGSQVTLADGSKVVADDAYLTESILNPDAKIVKDYEAGLMPSFAGMLDAGQVKDVDAYIHSLGGH